MRILGNILWFILGGLVSSLVFFIIGVIFCITILGIPFGLQMFKIGKLMILPFGKEIETNFDEHPIMNIFWVIFLGLIFAIGHLFIALFFFITIIGIPFGKQHLKLMKLSFIPFGAEID